MRNRLKSDRPADATRLLLAVVCICSFLSRYSVDVGRFDVRPEHLATTALAGWTLSKRSTRARFWGTLRDPLIAIFGAYVLVSIGATLAFAPNPAASSSIIAWLALDVVLLASLLTAGSDLRVVERVGMALVLPWAALGFLVATAATHLDWRWGTQFDPVYGVHSAYATAYEANIFAAVVTFWALLLVASQRVHRRVPLAAAVVVPLAILASQTRAAVIALAAGLVVLLTFRARGIARHQRAPSGSRFGPGVVLAVLVLLYAVVTLWPGVGTALISASPPHQSAQIEHRDVADTKPGAGAATGTAVGYDPGPNLPPGSRTPAPSPTSSAESNGPVPGASAIPRDKPKLSDFSGDSNNAQYRRMVAEIALRDMRGIRLVVGNGTNTFGQRHEDPTLKGVPGYLGSLPLQILYDNGLIGVALLVSFMVVVLRRIPRSQRPFGYAALLAFAITSTLTSTLWFATTWIMIAILVMPRPDAEGRGLSTVSSNQAERGR